MGEKFEKYTFYVKDLYLDYITIKQTHRTLKHGEKTWADTLPKQRDTWWLGSEEEPQDQCLEENSNRNYNEILLNMGSDVVHF